jgi:hypothetical protein
MADIYRVREAFHYTDAKGVPQFAHTDLLVSGDDPIVAKWPLFVEPVEVAVARAAGIEDASADPGSLRSVSTKRRGRKVTTPETPAEPEPPTEPEAPAAPAEKE